MKQAAHRNLVVLAVILVSAFSASPVSAAPVYVEGVDGMLNYGRDHIGSNETCEEAAERYGRQGAEGHEPTPSIDEHQGANDGSLSDGTWGYAFSGHYGHGNYNLRSLQGVDAYYVLQFCGVARPLLDGGVVNNGDGIGGRFHSSHSTGGRGLLENWAANAPDYWLRNVAWESSAGGIMVVTAEAGHGDIASSPATHAFTALGHFPYSWNGHGGWMRFAWALTEL